MKINRMVGISNTIIPKFRSFHGWIINKKFSRFLREILTHIDEFSLNIPAWNLEYQDYKIMGLVNNRSDILGIKSKGGKHS